MATTILGSPPGIIATSTHRPYRLTVTGRYLLAGMLAVKPAPANDGRWSYGLRSTYSSYLQCTGAVGLAR
jgi:hypothetical protein